MAQLFWIIGLAGLLIVWAWQTSRARRPGAHAEVVPRLIVLPAFGLAALLAFTSAFVWGSNIAEEGMARVRAVAAGRTAHEGPAPPARVRLFLRYVQLFFDPPTPDAPLHATVGYSPTASMKLPRDYQLDEAARSLDVLTIEEAGPQGVRVVPLVAGTRTRVLVTAARTRPEGAGAADPGLDEAARALIKGGRCRKDIDPPVPDPSNPTTTYVVLCDGDDPKAALVLERELGVRDAAAVDTPVRVRPYVWRGNGFRQHHVQLGAGNLFQIGAVADALPGMTVWEVPAPAGRPGLMFPPRNLLASCESWIQNNAAEEGGFFYPTLGLVEKQEVRAGADSFSCVLPFTPPFALEVRRLLPDVAGVRTRSLWAVTFVTAPALLLLACLLLRRPSARGPAIVASALALTGVSLAVGAIACYRLLWAHRIDMLRDYEAVGTRVLENQVLTIVVGAALAANAVGLWTRPERAGGKAAMLALSTVGFCAYAVLGWTAIGPDLAFPPSDGRHLAQLGFGLAVGTAAAWWGDLWHTLDRLVKRLLPGKASQLPSGLVLAPLGLVILGAFIVAATAKAPLSVPAKLGAAWSFVCITYLALRAARGPLALIVTVALVGLDLLLLVRFDTGVSMAIAACGLLFAALAAAHDRVHSDADARLLDNYGQFYRPLVITQAALVLVLAFALLVWALLGISRAYAGKGGDPGFPRAMTLGSLHTILILVVFFAAAAAALFRRSQVKRHRSGAVAAVAVGVVALAILVGWFGRGALVGRALASRKEAGQRIGSILDPSYALLHSERSFVAGLTAWRETAVKVEPRAAAATLGRGQGYFGAQVLDPGVLLSIENDYLPIMLLRETGAAGVCRVALLLAVLVGAAWIVGGGRFPEGSASLRLRRIVAALLGLLCLYQPLASLGALPFTGISWPGLGIDSPTDLWVLVALLLFLFVWSEHDTPAVEKERARLDDDLRRSAAWKSSASLVYGAAGALTLVGVLVVLRVSAFAMERREPVEVVTDDKGQASVRLNPPFDGLEDAFDYVYRMQCAPGPLAGTGTAALPRPLLPEPSGNAGLVKYHAALVSAWDSDAAAAERELSAFLGGGACTDKQLGHWRTTPIIDDQGEGTACRFAFKYGWPEVALTYRAPARGAWEATCEIGVSEEIVQVLRYPPRRPYAGARIRLVSRAMGRPAADVGELVSGDTLLRLRPGASAEDLSSGRPGVFIAGRARLGQGIEIAVDGEGTGVVLQASVAAAAEGEATAPGSPVRVLTREPPPPKVHLLEAAEARWETVLVDPREPPVRLDRMSVIVASGAGGRRVWLYRPPAAWPGEIGATVNPLLADDVSTILGARQRRYVYGGHLPELGWVNASFAALGLDGWTSTAVRRYERAEVGEATGPSIAARFVKEHCGTLAPPVPPHEGPEADEAFARVCLISPVDGVLECRVSLQPELQVRLKHLLELIAERPELFTDAGGKREFRPAVAASFALLRGDTGEILAQGSFVPGRESTAYAPTTPSLEKYLADARADRREERGAVKADWVQPIAIGSTLKPLLARAVQRAAPEFAAKLELTAGARSLDECEPLLGHCPPTKTVWEHDLNGNPADMATFIARSLNWYQAALGFLGTAVPDGDVRFGDGEAMFPPTQLDVSSFDIDRGVSTSMDGEHGVILWNGKKDGGSVDVSRLRQTPMWTQFEALLGRPLCTGMSKEDCVASAERRDVCAARALPVAHPGRDLRHLVAIGPATFDFADEGRVNARPHIKDYFQLLRGSGKHPLGSTLQLADAFNRLFYEPKGTDAPVPYGLAASWYPAPLVGRVPDECGPLVGDDPVRAGLCGALARDTHGTADALEKHFDDPGIVLYGAKTGTVDSLGDLVERRSSCQRFNDNHTIPGAKQQPYHLDCASESRAQLNDSLLVLAFGVVTPRGNIVPLTLALRFQRVGPVGFAVQAAEPFLDLIADYFGARRE